MGDGYRSRAARLPLTLRAVPRSEIEHVFTCEIDLDAHADLSGERAAGLRAEHDLVRVGLVVIAPRMRERAARIVCQRFAGSEQARAHRHLTLVEAALVGRLRDRQVAGECTGADGGDGAFECGGRAAALLGVVGYERGESPRLSLADLHTFC